jgi:hypothetical protein
MVELKVDLNQGFWTSEATHWPGDSSEYTALARAFHIFGKAMFADEWTKLEASNIELADAKERWCAVIAKLTTEAEAGALITACQLEDGTFKKLSRNRWNLYDGRLLLKNCLIEHHKAYEHLSTVSGESLNAELLPIFVERASLDNCLSPSASIAPLSLKLLPKWMNIHQARAWIKYRNPSEARRSDHEDNEAADDMYGSEFLPVVGNPNELTTALHEGTIVAMGCAKGSELTTDVPAVEWIQKPPYTGIRIGRDALIAVWPPISLRAPLTGIEQGTAESGSQVNEGAINVQASARQPVANTGKATVFELNAWITQAAATATEQNAKLGADAAHKQAREHFKLQGKSIEGQKAFRTRFTLHVPLASPLRSAGNSGVNLGS